MVNSYNYSYIKKYNSRCNPGYHYNPDHIKSDKKGCLKDSDLQQEYANTKEKFGSFSIGAALKCPQMNPLNNFYYAGVS